MDRDAEIMAANGIGTDMPPLTVLRDMLEDFTNLHSRVISVVVGHEFGSRGTAFPPIDVRKECITLTLKLRDPDANPASVFEFTGGLVSTPISAFPPKLQQTLAPYTQRLWDTNVECSSEASMCVIPALRKLAI